MEQEAVLRRLLDDDRIELVGTVSVDVTSRGDQILFRPNGDVYAYGYRVKFPQPYVVIDGSFVPADLIGYSKRINSDIVYKVQFSKV